MSKKEFGKVLWKMFNQQQQVTICYLEFVMKMLWI